MEKLTERVYKEREETLNAAAHVDTGNLQIEMDVYGNAAGKSPARLRAEVFARLCREKPIFIDNNPIVGNLTKYKYGAYLVTINDSRFLKTESDFSLQRGACEKLSDEELALIRKAGDFWAEKDTYSHVIKAAHERGIEVEKIVQSGVAIAVGENGQHQVWPDYEQLLNIGLTGVLERVESYKKQVSIANPEGLEKIEYYEAVEIVLRGAMALAQRYSDLAKEMARDEKDSARKQELLDIADRCARVPVYPARDFRDAIQVVWFMFYYSYLELPAILISPPLRFPQYMYPFYNKDIAEGKITDEEVIELIHFWFLRINSIANVMTPTMAPWNSSRLAEQLTIGGLTPDGEDATNELDFLLLEAQRRIMLPEPLLALVYHDKLSNKFLQKCVELIRTGVGQPAFHNVRQAMERCLLYDQMPLEEARNIAISGCLQSLIPGCTESSFEARVNLAKFVELTLNNGVSPLTKDQVGPQTGEAENFKTYEEFEAAYKKQLDTLFPVLREASQSGWSFASRYFPSPWASSMTHDCLERGMDISAGGARYHWHDGLCFSGGVDATNSLAAIRQLVYEDKKITMSQLKEALAANFEGYDEILKMCKDAPKYGNDNKEVDGIYKDMTEYIAKLHDMGTDYLGRPNKAHPGAYSVTTHWPFGYMTGALPNGRLAGVSLTDATASAQPGTDVKGPTALAKSAARAIDTVKWNSNHLNMKFHPTALEGAEGANKLLSMIKTYMDLGGYHMQFNCVSSETLKKAQKDPDKYRNLVVRVAGFSAFFVTLEKGVQDELIARTELTM